MTKKANNQINIVYYRFQMKCASMHAAASSTTLAIAYSLHPSFRQPTTPYKAPFQSHEIIFSFLLNFSYMN
jgi:transcription initiation factor IIF auxiliary subunit